MNNKRGIFAATLATLCFAFVSPVFAQSGDSLAVGRKMLIEDNPGELWIDQGKALFYEKRGPRNVSLEQCDFGMGPGKLEGAAARLPRYFADTDRVEDLETRLLTCMTRLQGFDRDQLIKTAISAPASKGSDIEALALYITSRSNGMKVNVALGHQKEYDMYKTGEYLFYRRSGQTDFGCVQCHGGPLLSDQGFHALGVPRHAWADSDPLVQITARWQKLQRGVSAVQYKGSDDDLGLAYLTRNPADAGRFAGAPGENQLDVRALDGLGGCGRRQHGSHQ